MIRRSPLVFLIALLITALTVPASAGARDDHSRIVGGSEADPADYPFVAAVVDHFSADAWIGHRCGGTVVGSRFVLTTAACVEGDSPSTIDVIAGRHDLTSADGDRLPVSAIHVHPDLDAALLEVASPLSVTPAVIGPVPADGDVTIVGWGDTRSTPRLPEVRHHAALPVQTDPACVESYGTDFSAATMMCAGDLSVGGTGICEGDGGGPMLAPDSTGGWLLVGVASWSIGCSVEGFPSVGVEASAIHGWVQSFGASEAITCDGLTPTHLGTEGADVIVGTDGDDVIIGLGGRDLIDAGDGNDIICAGPGRDQVAAGPGDDLVFGGDGNDSIDAGPGDDVLDGGAGDDVLFCGLGHDHAIGGSGADRIHGGRGTDRIEGGDGADRIIGGPAGDVIDGGEGNDTIQGGEGDDLISGGPGNDRIMGNADVDTISGDSGSDTLHGNEGDDELSGGSGDDTLIGGTGADNLSGDDGSDELHGRSGSDHLDGGDGDDVLAGELGADDLDGGAGSDRLDGGPSDDVLTGGAGDDLLKGMGADDTLIGNGGDDTLVGGIGNDSAAGGVGTDACRAESHTSCEKAYRLPRL